MLSERGHFSRNVMVTVGVAHTARTTIDYLKKEHNNFIEPHMWPPNSPDINPVDYAIWGALQQRVYHQRQFKTVEELK